MIFPFSVLSWFITKFSIYTYLSTYKIYIKIRGEDLVPCRGEENPIPLISRLGSGEIPAYTRSSPTRGVLRDTLPTAFATSAETLFAPPIISRRGSARVRRGHSTFPFLVLPEVLCEGFCLLPCLGPLRTPPLI